LGAGIELVFSATGISSDVESLLFWDGVSTSIGLRVAPFAYGGLGNVRSDKSSAFLTCGPAAGYCSSSKFSVNTGVWLPALHLGLELSSAPLESGMGLRWYVLAWPEFSSALPSPYDTFLRGLGALKSWTTVPLIRKSRLSCCLLLLDVKASGANGGIACEVRLRASSDIGLSRFSLAFPDLAGVGSNVETLLGGGDGSLAPLGRLPVGTPLL
jgi:hypothetical protein